MNILVIKSRHIGDVLLTGPLLSTLRLRHPDSHITVLVKAGTEAMLTGHPHVDAVITFPVRRPGEGRVAFLIRQWLWLRGLRQRRPDRVFNTTEGDRGVIATFVSGGVQRIGFRRQRGDKWWRRGLLTHTLLPRGGIRHTVLHNLDLVGEGPQDRHVHLRFAAADAGRAERLLREAGWDGERPLVQIHPASRWRFKCWTVHGMAGVADFCAQQGCQVVLTTSPDAGEIALAAAIAQAGHQPVINLGGLLTLKELAALTARCRLFFGVDTAPMHMAAAMDVPVIALYGPSGTYDWGPWPNGWAGDGSPFGRLNGVQESFPHWVIQKTWSCVPCGRAGCEGSKRSRCLEELTLAEVLPLVEQVLRREGLWQGTGEPATREQDG
ncbi:MAG: putative lipopolysaccharide heptosyltransferase III [Magnetococcus sp. DMHC-8]